MFFEQKSPRHPEVGVLGTGPKPHILTITEKTNYFFYFLLCHHRPIFKIRSSTSGLPDSRKWVFRDGTDRHTHRHCDTMTESAQRVDSVKILRFISITHPSGQCCPWPLESCANIQTLYCSSNILLCAANILFCSANILYLNKNIFECIVNIMYYLTDLV